MSKIQPWVVSVLSTCYDLEHHRKRTIDFLEKNGFTVSAYELSSFPVDPYINSHEACVKALERVDISIVIINKRWGGEYIGDKNISITLKEYLESLKLNKMVLTFVSVDTWNERYKYQNFIKQETQDKARNYTPEYVDDIKVLDFVERVHRSRRDNYISFYKSEDDLIDKIKGRLKGLSRSLCEKITSEQKSEVEKKHTTTGLYLSFLDVFSNKYYIEPHYTIESGTLPRAKKIDSRILKNIENSHSTLLLGGAGSGKTTILAKCFLSHANMASKKKSYALPFYISLKEKDFNYHFDYRKFIDDSFGTAMKKKPYPLMVLEDIQPVFYFDGFDEIAESLTEKDICRISGSSMFNYPSLLTCRRQYTYRYLNCNDFTDIFRTRVSVGSWDLVMAEKYIDNFCEIKNKDATFCSSIKRTIKSNPDLANILNSPLLVTMFLWVVENENMIIPHNITSKVELFSACINELASREIKRLETKILTASDLIVIWSYAAWEVYAANIRDEKIKIQELMKKLKLKLGSLPDEYKDSMFDALFECNAKNIITGTLHDQFLKYLVANAMYIACSEDQYPFPEFLEYIINPEINRYFRSLCKQDFDVTKKERIVNRFWKEYLNSTCDSSPVAIYRRVHAVYHLTRLQTEDFDKYSRIIRENEKSIAVLLSYYYGLIKQGNYEIEEECYQLLTNDLEAQTYNQEYHQKYYFDKDSNWIGTFTGMLRHFSLENDYHQYYWRLELLTMRNLVEKNKLEGPLYSENVRLIENAIGKASKTFDSEFYRKVSDEFDKLVDTLNTVRALT